MDDAMAMQAFVQGFLVMTCMTHLAEFSKVSRVEQLTEPDGTYSSFFTIIYESGVRVMVSFDSSA